MDLFEIKIGLTFFRLIILNSLWIKLKNLLLLLVLSFKYWHLRLMAFILLWVILFIIFWFHNWRIQSNYFVIFVKLSFNSTFNSFSNPLPSFLGINFSHFLCKTFHLYLIINLDFFICFEQIIHSNFLIFMKVSYQITVHCWFGTLDQVFHFLVINLNLLKWWSFRCIITFHCRLIPLLSLINWSGIPSFLIFSYVFWFWFFQIEIFHFKQNIK